MALCNLIYRIRQPKKRDAMKRDAMKRDAMKSKAEKIIMKTVIDAAYRIKSSKLAAKLSEERGDVPGWVLVVLMTTGLVTAIWTIAAPRLTTILKSSLDAMNGIR